MDVINTSDIAPEFSAQSTHNEHITLKRYKGSFLLISFYRYASCPFCNLRVHESIEFQNKMLYHNIKLLAIFQSPKEKIMQYVGKQEVSFPIISDPEKILYSLYGVQKSWLGLLIAIIIKIPKALYSIFWRGFIPGSIENGINQLPADFLIGPDGTVLISYYGKDISDHLPFDKIYKTISEYNIA